MPHTIRTFSEREFYRGEFRGRSIGIAWPAEEPPTAQHMAAVIDELTSNGSRVIVMSPVGEVFALAGIAKPVDASDARFAPGLWRDLRESGRAGVQIPENRFAEECRRISLSLRLAKVVWIRSQAPVERVEGASRISVLDLGHLEPLLGQQADLDARLTGHRVREGCAGMLAAVRDMIEGGIPSVNVCAPGDIARELFTYAGAGTLFTKNRYAEVRPLAIDDYDLANDVIERGEADGYLAPRGRAERDAVLAHGVGVFIEGRYLAGIGAILPHPSANAAELASLFALTRYVGEGAGAQIVRYAIDQSRAAGLDYLFSCTTSSKVESFFEGHGFRRVEPTELPDEKWVDYDALRKSRVRCLRIDLRG